MIRYMSKMMVAGLVGLVWVAPAAAGEIGIGFSFNQGRGGPQIGVGFRLGAEPVIVQPVATRTVWVPTVEQTYRNVPVYGAWGQIVNYRRELVKVPSGHWVTVPQPVVPAPRAVGIGRPNFRGDRDDHRGHEAIQTRSQLNQRHPAAGGSRAGHNDHKGGHH
jgi:hypothetical protein